MLTPHYRMQVANQMRLDQQHPVSAANRSAKHNGMSYDFYPSVWCRTLYIIKPLLNHLCSTHRQRTQNYIKTLESEVVRLRGSESSLVQEKENLQGKLEILRTTCQLAGIPLPDGIDQTHQALSQRAISINPTLPATVSFHKDSMSNQRLHVQWPSPPTLRGNPQPVHSQAGYNNDQTQTFQSTYSDPPYVPNPPNSMPSPSTQKKAC